MKRAMAMLLTAAMAVTLFTGCGGKEADKDQKTEAGGTEETKQEASGKEENDGQQAADDGQEETNDGDTYDIAIEMLYFGMEDPDMQEVIDAINEITVPAINATVSFVPTSFTEAATKPGLWHSSGDKVDVLITGMMTDPQQLAAQGLLYPMDDLLAESETLTGLAGDLLKACRYEGVTYAYPLDLYPGNGQAYFYDEELAEQYNITLPESIETEAELEEVLEQVKASGMSQYAMTYGDGEIVAHSYGYEMENFGDNYCSRGVILDEDGGTQVVNWYATDTFKKMCELHRDWYEKGYLIPDSLTNGYTYLDNLSQGTVFGFISSDGASVGEAYYETQTGRKLGKVEISDVLIRTSDVAVNTWGIASSCENPKKVIEFMELLYTDAELANLFNYGIEGKHYVVEEGSRLMSYPEGVDMMSAGYGTCVTAGSFGDRTILNAWGDKWTEETLEAVTKYGVPDGELSKYLGLNYNLNNVTTENAAVMAVILKYRASLACGVVDVEETLPKFISELEAAGMNKILEDTQKQVDEYLEQQ